MKPLVFAATGMILVLAAYVWASFALLRQNGRLQRRVDALEDRARRPPAVRPGQRAPSLELAGLDGRRVNLSTPPGRRTLLLFWDPASAQCGRMLPDLETRARVSLSGAPDIVIVATGAADDIRALDFDWPVLLDPRRAARTAFGVEEVPSAVLIAPDGRLESGVVAGYIATFELIGLVPYVATDASTVDGMLKLADVTKDDVVFDLGCGDGRIVITAARVYGARAVGVDVNAERLEEARAAARAAGVEHLVRFEQREFADCDLREATVVTMYLLPAVVRGLRPKLLAELRPGARVVSHAFEMDDWVPDRETTVNGDSVYLWTVPARAP